MDMNYRGDCGREGVGRMEWSGVGKWDNCNSIINKYIKKRKKKESYIQTGRRGGDGHWGGEDSRGRGGTKTDGVWDKQRRQSEH